MLFLNISYQILTHSDSKICRVSLSFSFIEEYDTEISVSYQFISKNSIESVHEYDLKWNYLRLIIIKVL